VQTRAAVLRAVPSPLVLEDITLDPPRAGEVLIRMVAAGICGSDKHVLDGHFPSPVPAVCGHEGAGVVEAVGPGTTGIAVGDHVIHTFVGPCGECRQCRRGRRTFCEVPPRRDGALCDGTFRMHDADGADIATTLGLGSFAAHTVTPAKHCVVIDPAVDLALAALVSCGVSTGVGAVVNVARAQEGDTVVVLGFGGVGAAAVLGARLVGAARIVAVDITAAKREAAFALGVDEWVDAAGGGDLTAALLDACGPDGADRVILTTSQVNAEQYRAAIRCLAPGGVAVQVGSSERGLDHLPVDPRLFSSRQVYFTGTVYGGMDPAADARRWIEAYQQGRLPIGDLITARYALADIGDAFADLEAGRNIRGIVDYQL
jgi:Zn-dependent alcohol dehydrogenase